MPPKRTTATGLARLFNHLPQPVYVLDDELQVVFLNEACCQWLGPEADRLIGRRCAYHSGPCADGADRLAAALCPPPEVLLGREVTAIVHVARSGQPPGELAGGVSRRQVRFVPLGTGADEVIAVVAVAALEDAAPAAEGEPAVPQPAALIEQQPSDEPIHLHDLLQRFRAEAAIRYGADRLVGYSPAMRRARQQVELAAQSRCNVSLVGPPGSGRQHLAAAIHYGAGAAQAGSLVPLACGVLGPELIHSTVTALARKGTLGDRASRSTLLLGDVDELAPEDQAQLAAELCGRHFPLRVIATSRQTLEELVRRRQFRDDLAAALSTLVIQLPPLAERREDLPLLAQLFLEELNARSSRQLTGFTPEAMDLLVAYSWPGNLDELAQVVAEAHRRAGGTLIEPAHLPERIHLADEAARYAPRRPERIVLDEFLKRVERELIRRALAQAKGNKARAARLLGLTRPRLYRRMAQLGLE